MHAAADAVDRAADASRAADAEADGVPLEVLRLARDVSAHLEASSRTLAEAAAVLERVAGAPRDGGPTPG